MQIFFFFFQPIWRSVVSECSLMANGFQKKKKAAVGSGYSDWPVLHVYTAWLVIHSSALLNIGGSESVRHHWALKRFDPTYWRQMGEQPRWLYRSARHVGWISWMWNGDGYLSRRKIYRSTKVFCPSYFFSFFFPRVLFLLSRAFWRFDSRSRSAVQGLHFVFCTSFKGKWGSALVSLARRRPWRVFNPPVPL